MRFRMSCVILIFDKGIFALIEMLRITSRYDLRFVDEWVDVGRFTYIYHVSSMATKQIWEKTAFAEAK